MMKYPLFAEVVKSEAFCSRSQYHAGVESDIFPVAGKCEMDYIFLMLKKTILGTLAGVFFAFSSAYAEEAQSICPVMVESDIDEEEVVTYLGKTIYMCCGGCVKAWDKNPDYYFKIAQELKLLPQFKDVSAEHQAKIDKIELMEQRFCPLKPECVVSPTSPSIEYNGKKIYFFKERDIKRKWEKDPKAAFEKARKAGLLPQFDEKK